MDIISGKIIHSQSFKSAIGYENKTAVVVGIGSSGCDVAIELRFDLQVFEIFFRRSSFLTISHFHDFKNYKFFLIQYAVMFAIKLIWLSGLEVGFGIELALMAYLLIIR